MKVSTGVSTKTAFSSEPRMPLRMAMRLIGVP